MTTTSIIYHYTTISGLIGIVTHHELWASDCRFLNDGTELTYARDKFFTEVRKLKLPPLEDGGYILAGRKSNYFRMFIVCFCENGDLLSQWRGYAADQGYALGFDVKLLKAQNQGELISVRYGIENPAEYFKQELNLASQPTAHPGVAEWYASESLLPRLAGVKHPSFAEEQEWRLIKQLPAYELNEHNYILKFRLSSMGPVAYIVNSFSPTCLREIVVGPGSYITPRVEAVQSMLEYLGLREVKVRVSKTPLRR